MPAHRGAGIHHLYSNTILNVVVEIASFFVFAYARSTSTTKLITCIERTKNLEKSVSSQPLQCTFIKLELEKCSLKISEGFGLFYNILHFIISPV